MPIVSADYFVDYSLGGQEGLLPPEGGGSGLVVCRGPLERAGSLPVQQVWQATCLDVWLSTSDARLKRLLLSQANVELVWGSHSKLRLELYQLDWDAHFLHGRRELGGGYGGPWDGGELRLNLHAGRAAWARLRAQEQRKHPGYHLTWRAGLHYAMIPR